MHAARNYAGEKGAGFSVGPHIAYCIVHISVWAPHRTLHSAYRSELTLENVHVVTLHSAYRSELTLENVYPADS